jgi:ribonucleoside-diphosphate reductase alpha chain
MQTITPLDPVPTAGIPVDKADKPKEQLSAAEAPEQQDLFARAQRRKLPDERKSITHKFSVGGHEGYIIVGMYAEGAPGEIFIKMAKEGSTLSGFMDGLALSISIGLQYGVPLKALVDKLTNTRFEPSGFTENPSIRYASSVLDYIARWLGGKFLSPEYLKPRAAVSEQGLAIQTGTRAPSANTRDPESVPPGNRGTATGDAPSCSTCGMLMVPNGSCYKCVNCGSTSGCS